MIRYVVAINGSPESGKDTFVEQCNKVTDVIYIDSVGPVKDVMKILGWNGIKDDQFRLHAHQIKKIWKSQSNGPVRYMTRELMTHNYEVAFLNIREADEIEEMRNIVDCFGYVFSTLLITRPGYEGGNNSSDCNVKQFNYDIEIDNTGTKDDLLFSAINYIDNYLRRMNDGKSGINTPTRSQEEV